MAGIVMQYYISFLDMKYKRWEYVVDPDKVGRQLTEKEAKEIIQKKGLVKVLDTSDGVIYDSPSQDFLKKFKGVEIKREN